MLAELMVLTNIAFTTCFSTDHRVPVWTYYELTPQEVVKMKRIDFPFHADPRVPGTDLDAAYRNSGYDRGHMAPAADFNFDFNALYETYAFSNIAPQDPQLNRGLWADAEAEVRRFAKEAPMHVLTFPVLDGCTNRIGGVIVPSAFVKVAWGPCGLRMWWLTNRVDVTPPAPGPAPRAPAR